MGLLILLPVIILIAGALVTATSYKRMTKYNVSMAGLWATVIFVGFVLIAGLIAFYALANAFSR